MKLIASREAYRCPIFRVTDDELSGGVRRTVVRHTGSAAVLAVDDQRRVLLVRQYRWPAQRAMWELCAGRVDPGETPLAAAKRELREETGLRARRWKKLSRFWASPGFLDEQMHLFLAEGLTQGERVVVEDEEVEARWFPAPEALRMARDGRLPDAKTMLGLLLWAQEPNADF